MSTEPVIDLRSDTVTRPGPAMREAMAQAEVGDDVYGEDPTAHALEARVAEIVGKEGALFVPSGTMSNQIALLCHARRGDEVYIGEGAHLAFSESGAGAAWAGVQFVEVGRGGLFDAEALAQLIKPVAYYLPRPRVVAVENTHNRAGGRVFPQADVLAIAAVAREHGLALHLDGARIWNAAAATGRSERELAAPFDSVSVCFSKGLGAPAGSALCGSRALIEDARRFRKMLGGGMRQVGVLAAAALFAVDRHRERVAEDHQNAAAFARALAEAAPRAAASTPETNIVNVDLPVAADRVAAAARERGLLIGASDTRRLRAVFHLDATRACAGRAASILAAALDAVESADVKLAAAALALALAGGAGCGGGPAYAPGYLEAFDAGRRAHTAGRLEEAARSFEQAYRKAGRVKDRDEALLLLARTQEQLGRAGDARKTWRLLAEARPGGPRGVRAEFELARLAGGPDEEARDAREIELIGRHPDHGMAVAALTRVVGRRREKQDWGGLLAVLDRLSPPATGTPLEQHVEVERGRALESKGDLEAALRVYLATARAHPYPHGPRTDDAFWRASHVEERLGRHALAIAHLREMLGPRESSQGGGSYERPKFPAAQMRIALLLRDRARDPDGARDELHRLVDGFPDSTMRDDALWISARIARDGNDASGACSDAKRIASSMPDSRYARCAHLLCDQVKPGAQPCADYLVRELRGEVSGDPEGLDDDEASVREGEGSGDGEPDPGHMRDVDAPAR